MKYINLKARAKINLTLDVLGKRDDGYHEIQMIMQSVSLYDVIRMEKIDSKSHINLKTNLKWLPCDNRNLAYKAAEIMKERFNIKKGIFIGLEKRIPVSAGLAGGSTDCAAVIVGINKLFSLGLSTQELMDIGAILGSDVPFCIKRGTALAEGRGEIITSLTPAPEFYVVLVKLPVSVSTAKVYGGLNIEKIKERPNTKLYMEALEKKDRSYITSNICNVLESVTIPMVPEIEKIKEHLINNGAHNAMMSGSGPTVFGLFTEKQVAEDAALAVTKDLDITDVFVTEFFNPR